MQSQVQAIQQRVGSHPKCVMNEVGQLLACDARWRDIKLAVSCACSVSGLNWTGVANVTVYAADAVKVCELDVITRGAHPSKSACEFELYAAVIALLGRSNYLGCDPVADANARTALRLLTLTASLLHGNSTTSEAGNAVAVARGALQRAGFDEESEHADASSATSRRSATMRAVASAVKAIATSDRFSRLNESAVIVHESVW